ncbi:unnamed protein product [Timema podura]|uniref:Uncharacterized protein n=1 Tax=Timema podura TaxID=61482 RepID=A0ABN7NJW8_TIMPD|nr:unnamed protein product [Timema podura]
MTRCMIDFVHAVHTLPEGFLWSGKLTRWQSEQFPEGNLDSYSKHGEDFNSKNWPWCDSHTKFSAVNRVARFHMRAIPSYVELWYYKVVPPPSAGARATESMSRDVASTQFFPFDINSTCGADTTKHNEKVKVCDYLRYLVHQSFLRVISPYNRSKCANLAQYQVT